MTNFFNLLKVNLQKEFYTTKLGVYFNNRIRRLTPRECARLQGYPDSFKLHPKNQFAYKQLGNAVSVPVIKTLFCDFINNNRDILDKDIFFVSA